MGERGWDRDEVGENDVSDWSRLLAKIQISDQQPIRGTSWNYVISMEFANLLVTGATYI